MKNLLTVFRSFSGEILVVVLSATLLTAMPAPASETENAGQFLKQFCLDCHSGPDAENAFDIESLRFEPENKANLAKWVRIFERVERGEMPPKDYDQPDLDSRASFIHRLENALSKGSASLADTVLRRLNRQEYENTLNDMLGTRESLVDLLPEDGSAQHFDNIGEALDLSAVHLERYMTAAAKAIDAAIRTEPKPEALSGKYSLGDGKNNGNLGKHWHQQNDGAVVIFNNGGFPRPTLESFKASREGLYRIRVRGYAYQSSEPVRFELWQGTFGRDSVSAKVGVYQFSDDGNDTLDLEVWLKPGATLVILPRLNVDNAKLRQDGPKSYPGPGLALHDFEIEGPIYDSWPGAGHRLLFGDLPTREIEPSNPRAKGQKWYRPSYEVFSDSPQKDCEQLLKTFSSVAFRRPATSEQLEPIKSLVLSELERGESFQSAMRTGYIAALCSPNFLYFSEPKGRLDDHAIACRLSYAIWNTLPDAELRLLADRGQLRQPEVLRAQLDRLLDDERSNRFVRTFTGQWLNLRDIDFTIPDKQLYPEYDSALRDGMLEETELFFAEILKNNLSVLDFVDSDWTMLNERLAQHYNIPGVEGNHFRKVTLEPEHHRGGVVTQASVLKVSANGTTTSPVVRGIFVLERLLGIEPPAPPPGVPGVEPDIRGSTTLREQLEKHRELESCNNCHKLIDPPGFALENYDVMGGWRDNYRSLNTNFPAPDPKTFASILGPRQNRVRWRIGPLVDASGSTETGQEFANWNDYKQLLIAEPHLFTKAFTQKIAAYMSGREMQFADRQEIDRIAKSIDAQGFGFRDLLHEVVQSKLFQQK